MLLESKNAVIYGGGGPVGGAVARAFAREGARVFLAGRTLEPVRRVAAEIEADGGRVEAATVDALDERAVDEHAARVVHEAGSIDISFNAIGRDDVHGAPLLEMPFEDFARPVHVAIKTLFLTARAAARSMVQRGSGVILAITATTAKMAIPQVGGTGVAFDATESLCRQWASELGPLGIRVAWLQTTGLPEALADVDVFPDYGTRGGQGLSRQELVDWLRDKTMINRLTSLAELGDAASFLASDRASATTGVGMNLTGGSVRD